MAIGMPLIWVGFAGHAVSGFIVGALYDGSVGGMTLDDDEDERGAYVAASSASSTIFDEENPKSADSRGDDSEEQSDIFDMPDIFMEEKEALAEGLSLIEDEEEGD